MKAAREYGLDSMLVHCAIPQLFVGQPAVVERHIRPANCIERTPDSRYHGTKDWGHNMQGLVIWGRDNSVNVQKVLWCCEEIGVPYQRIDAGGNHGVVNTASYREINPNSLVP